ncbi:iron ABC transporter permease [Cryobacterium arcticum]|uniref:Iron ABC transporter permease n=1 Tax=Cryobacterium arcticum TaxID=670052 RepID=A0A317ZT02_9MICO|nr:iron ABC transporter permease [Cryobacterium arcticum]
MFLALLSLAVGSKDLGLNEVWTGLLAADGSRESIIIWQLRMPRTALAIIVGAALAVAGVLMQALTRNPLAEPGLLGVNAGAAFSVVLALSVFGATTIDEYLWFAFLGAGAAACFVYVISARRSLASDHARLVLAGAALTASLGACTAIITMFDADTFNSYRFWVIGSVADRGIDTALYILPFVAVGLIAAFVSGPSLNALALGDEQAKALGVRLSLVRVIAMSTITLLCGAATAAVGPIAFVGLVVPHLLRLIVGVDQRTLLVTSAVAGPVLVLAADIVGRIIQRPGELEVGIVTAFVGAPALIVILLRGRTR